jgi:hypothetical protein
VYVPYTSLCFNQWWYSITPGLGMSLALPIIGRPLGPGGRGRALLSPCSHRRSIYAMRRPKVPRAIVAASPMLVTSVLRPRREARIQRLRNNDTKNQCRIHWVHLYDIERDLACVCDVALEDNPCKDVSPPNQHVLKTCRRSPSHLASSGSRPHTCNISHDESRLHRVLL